MDDLRLNVLFSSISAVLGRWKGIMKEAVCNGTPQQLEGFRLRRVSNTGPLDQLTSAELTERQTVLQITFKDTKKVRISLCSFLL